MKRKSLLIITALGVVGILTASTILLYKPSQAANAPLPAGIDTTGSNLTLEGAVQVPSGNVTIVFDFTPLHNNASIVMLSTNMQIIDFRNVSTSDPGELTITNNYSGPFYIQTYGATWHLVVR